MLTMSTFKVQISDLYSRKDTIIQYRSSFKAGYVDSVIFRKKQTTIYTTLIDYKDYYRQKMVSEAKAIHF